MLHRLSAPAGARDCDKVGEEAEAGPLPPWGQARPRQALAQDLAQILAQALAQALVRALARAVAFGSMH